MRSGEDQIVRWLADQRRLDPQRFPIGIGDDMAQINLPSGGGVLITTDMLLSGVHFDLLKATPQQIGYKAMACSLSDCAAMASLPVGAVVAVGLPSGCGDQLLKAIHAGIMEAADRYGCPLAGGDITVWKDPDHLSICVAMLSVPCPGGPVRRSGAQVGDVICVTGWLGGSLQGRHLAFEPRLYEAQRLAGMVSLHAMMDISDGLASDLPRLCRSSGVGAVVWIADLPLSEQAMAAPDPVKSGLCDGEDFELLFTLSQEDHQLLSRAWKGPVPVTGIGQIRSGKGIQLVWPDGRTEDLKFTGYDHLSCGDD